MATLREGVENVIRYRQKSLNEAIKARELIGLLPPELQALGGDADTGYYGVSLRVSFYASANKGIDLLRTLKMAGVQGLNPKMASDTDSWFATGNCVLSNGDKVKVYAGQLPKPPACVIEAYQETVTKYKAICPETGEEIK